MASLQDAKFAALRSQGLTGSITDMMLQWLRLNGATSGVMSDAWREMLLILTGFPSAFYQRNDWWFTLLGDLGYQGSLNDRELQFWLDGGLLGTSGVRIITQPVSVSGEPAFDAVFTVVAESGDLSPLTYQWQRTTATVPAWTAMAGETAATLTITDYDIIVDDTTPKYRCIVTNAVDSRTSAVVGVNLIITIPVGYNIAWGMGFNGTTTYGFLQPGDPTPTHGRLVPRQWPGFKDVIWRCSVNTTINELRLKRGGDDIPETLSVTLEIEGYGTVICDWQAGSADWRAFSQAGLGAFCLAQAGLVVGMNVTSAPLPFFWIVDETGERVLTEPATDYMVTED